MRVNDQSMERAKTAAATYNFVANKSARFSQNHWIMYSASKAQKDSIRTRILSRAQAQWKLHLWSDFVSSDYGCDFGRLILTVENFVCDNLKYGRFHFSHYENGIFISSKPGRKSVAIDSASQIVSCDAWETDTFSWYCHKLWTGERFSYWHRFLRWTLW